MCAIGRDLDTSVGAQSPATAMLGTGAIGATQGSTRRTTLLTGGVGRTGTGAGAGTILAPVIGSPGMGGGGGRSSKNPMMER
jgi:hypothetical protein